ncbi:MAG: carbohydrate kinase [Nibricoccus sp.]
MSRPIFCFGEVLWDILPHGRFLGGAPLNVAYHLRRLGNDARLISAVGRDETGGEALTRIEAAGVDPSLISQHPSLPTGSVTATLDTAGQASYEIHHPVAWDEIAAHPKMTAPLKPAAIVFGSLALRGEANRDRLSEWLALEPKIRLCDLNLRPPYDDVRALDRWVRGCTILKVNEDEARKLSPETLDAAETEAHAAHLAVHYACENVCVTLGEKGALLWRQGEVFRAESPRVTVRDTIGAGDAFTAALLDGVIRGGTNIDWAAVLRRACVLGAFVAGKDGAQPVYDPTEVPGLRASA